MRLESLVVSQFRCWSYREFTFADGITYVRGPNASGKSSILEAINYLATGRSFRTSRDTTCVQWGKESFSLRGEFYHESPEDDPQSLALSYGSESTDEPDRRRVVKLNDELVETLSELRTVFLTVLFTPDDLSVLKGGPSERRALFDRLLSQVNPDYLNWLKEYETIRKQRNSLLKTPSPDHVLLDQYDERLAELGERIIDARSDLAPEIEKEVRSTASILLDEDGIETVEFVYEPDVLRDESFGEVLGSSRADDLEKGYTTRGPQRDDWSIKIRDRPVARFASQGQLRALLLTLKLASNSVIINRVSAEPILLLDDVESELDEQRQDRVLTLLREHASQVVITGTGHLNFSADGESETILSLEAR